MTPRQSLIAALLMAGLAVPATVAATEAATASEARPTAPSDASAPAGASTAATGATAPARPSTAPLEATAPAESAPVVATPATGKAKASAPARGRSAAAAPPRSGTKAGAPGGDRPAASPGTTARPRSDASTRTLEDIHIEGEIPVPQVLFITARDQRRFVGFQHRRYLRTSRKIGEDTVVPSRLVVTGAATLPERSHSDE